MTIWSGQSRATQKMRLGLVVLVLIAITGLSAQDRSPMPETTANPAIAIKLRQALNTNWAFVLAPVVTVSGRVLDANGMPASGAIVSLIPVNARSSNSEAVQRTLQTDARGNFAFRGVLPGSYLLLASLKQKSREYWSEQRIQVGENDIDGLPLQLRDEDTISGAVNTDGKSTLDFQLLQVQLSPEDGNSSEVSTGVNKDGAFRLDDVRRTTQRLHLSGLPDGWYMRSAVFGQQDVLKDGLKLGQGDADQSLKITVSSGVAKVEGVVIEPEYGDPASHAIVKLFPDPPNPHRTDLFRSAPTDRNGRFVITNVVPGKYRVIALMGGRTGSEASYEDAVTAATAGARVSVGENQSKSVELDLFEAHR